LTLIAKNTSRFTAKSDIVAERRLFQFQFQFQFIHVQAYLNRLENPPDIEQVKTINAYAHINESTVTT
jgi:hypothetical protein